MTDDEKEKVIDYLVSYSKMSRDEQRILILEWKRYAGVIGHRGRVFLFDKSSRNGRCYSPTIVGLIISKQPAYGDRSDGGYVLVAEKRGIVTWS